MKNKILLILFVLINLEANTLTLSNVYDMLLRQSHQSKSYDYQLQANKQRLEQINSSLYPQLSLSLSKNKTKYEINHLQRRIDYDITEDTNDITLNLKQTLYDKSLFESIKNEKLKQKLYLVDTNNKKNDLITQAYKIYFDILRTQNKITYLKSKYEFNNDKLKAIEIQFAMKLVNKMDYLQMQVQTATSKINLKTQERLLKINKMKLRHLLNYNFNSIELNTNLYTNADNIELLKEVINSSDISKNLSIKKAQISKNIYKNEINRAYAGYFPTITLSAYYTKYDSDDITTDYDNYAKVMLNINIPLYQGGTTKATVESSKLQYEASKEDYIQALDDTQVEFEKNLIYFNNAANSILLYKESLKSAKLYVDSIAQGLKSGLKSSVDLYEAKAKLNEVKYNYYDNIYNMLDSYINILILTDNINKIKYIKPIVREN